MTSSAQRKGWTLNLSFRPAIAALAAAIAFGLTVGAAQSARAQTFTVLHAFTGGADGSTPQGVGLTMDAAGNLYGGAAYGGQTGQCSYQGSCGAIYKLSRKGSGWIFNTLYEFTGSDGEQPDAPLVFGPDGALYSTTYYGGSYFCIDGGCGVVYSLRPPATPCKSTDCPWTETVLHQFTAEVDGARPAFGALTFDKSGNIYGTTTVGGQNPPYAGDVFELTRSGSQWSLNVLHTFTGQLDGGTPWSGVVFDTAGNLYGSTAGGGANGGGTAFQLTPSGENWTLTTIYPFSPDIEGNSAFCNLLLDSSGNLWGTTRNGGSGGAGTAFELTPSRGSWGLNLLYSFAQYRGSQTALIMDKQGNLYGTLVEGGKYGSGAVFKLTPSDDGWTYTSLHDFYGTDGYWPMGQIVMDGNGNLYGTASEGGPYKYGVVWEITP
jgi:uncharacterized repeat protein (TIGR03803 family)